MELTVLVDLAEFSEVSIDALMGHQYELMEDWEKAREYYSEGNVGKMNARALARLLTKEGKDEEAVKI